MEEVLARSKLIVPPDERSLERVRPAAPTTFGDDPQGTERWDGCDLALEELLAGRLEGDSRRCGAVGRFADEDRARWRDRLEPRGGIDDVAGDHPLVGGPDRDGRLAGQDPGPGADPGPDGSDGVDELEGGPHGALGVVLAGGRRSPDRHDGIADELLDRPAVAPDDLRRELEVAGQGLADLLAVALLGERREADEVGEQDRDQAALGNGGLDRRVTDGRRIRSTDRCDPGPRRRPPRPVRFQSPQYRLPGGLVAPHDGQPVESGAPQSPQNRLSEGFSVPQPARTTTRAPK